MRRCRPSKIWIDADSCPKAIKETVYKVAKRLNIPTNLVANSYQNTPISELIAMIVVDSGFDAADKYIIEHVEMHELVITADIPLAAEVLKKKAVAVNPRGEVYDEENICSILSMRDILKEFRDAGTITGGPPPFGPKDVQQFANALHKLTL